MSKLWKSVILILVFGIMATDIIIDYRAVAGVTLAITGDQDMQELPVGTGIGELAPDFNATTLKGDEFQLSNLRGEIVLVNVFASWCGPCLLETPHLVEASRLLDDEGVSFVGINQQENPEAVAGYQAEFDVNYPLVLDEFGELTQKLYKPIGLPTSWFLDEGGVVRFVFAGALTQESLLRIIEDIRAEREPNPFDAAG